MSGADTIGWDPEAGRIDAPALEGIDAIVHLAGEGIGEKRWTDEQKRKIRESRVRGTAVLAGAVASRERKPKVFVSASAIGYYGDRGDEILPEDSAPGTDFLAEVCVAWEAETKPASEAGVRTVLMRNGIVLDPHGGALAQMLLPFKLGIGGRQGSGKQWMSWITLADEIGAIRHAIDHESVRGAVNAVAPNPVTNAEFASHPGSRVAPPDGAADAAAPPEAPVRRRARRVAAAREPARRARPTAGDRLRIRRDNPRGGAAQRLGSDRG